MENEDERLIDIYMLGFNGYEITLKTDLEERAYELGQHHFVMGDDCRSFDFIPKEEILRIIHLK